MKKIVAFTLMSLFCSLAYCQDKITMFQKDSLIWTDDLNNTNIYPLSKKERIKYKNNIEPHIIHYELGICSTILTDTRRILIFVKPFEGVDYNAFANYFLKWMTGGIGYYIFVPYGIIVINSDELENINDSKNFKTFNILGKAYLRK
jgi:hypothetical protein